MVFIKTINKNLEIPVFLIDTIESFKLRIANTLETLPEYIKIKENYIISDLYENNNVELEIIDLLEIINIEYNMFDTFNSFFERFKNIFSLSYLQFFKIWLIKKENINLGLLDLKLTIFQNNIPNESDVNNILELFLKNKLTIDLDKKIKENLNDNNEQIIRDFEKIEKIENSNFFIEKKNIKLILKKSESTLLEIFNNIIVNKFVPFVTTNNLFKIYNNLIPFEDWNFSSDEGIILKILNTTKDIKKYNSNHYTTIGISRENDNFIIETQIYISDNYIKKNDLINILFDVLNLSTDIIEQNLDYSITGIFSYPQYKFNNYILADLCLNNNIFSRFIRINESQNAHKSTNSVYIYFTDPSNDQLLTANITQKIFDNKDTYLKKISIKNLKFNEPYIRIKVSKSENIKYIDRFITIFSKLMTIYYEEKDNIISFYRKYLPDFGIEKYQELKKEKIFLKNIVPQLFYPNYGTYCGFPPTIVDKETADTYPDNEKILFPKDDDIQRYYVCDETKHKEPGYKYPGIRKNPLENKDKYPYIPCCYKSIDGKIPNGRILYDKYMLGKDTMNVLDLNNRIITTRKILKNSNQLGILPLNISKLLQIYDINNFKYYRKGSSRTKNSFLECVLRGCGIPKIQNKLAEIDNNYDVLKKFLIEKRLELITNENIISICRQENYNINSQEIVKNISNLDTYLDPKLYIKLLEYIYQVNIFLFTDNENEGSILIPNHVNGYLQYINPYKKTIIIYEHMGSYTDNLDYPQCELIVLNSIKYPEQFLNSVFSNKIKQSIIDNVSKDSISNIQKYIYYQSSVIGNKLKKMLIKFIESYQLNRLLSRIRLPNINIISQYIDNYGKTRFLEINFNNFIIKVGVSPIPPLPVPEKKLDYFLTSNNYDIIKKFINENNMYIKSQYIKDGKTVEINVSSNEKFQKKTVYHILINEIDIFENIDITLHNHFFEQEESLLQIFNHNKRIARYLKEYVLWRFSYYIYENNIKINYYVHIKDFFEKNIEIIPNFKYENIFKKFYIDTGIMKDGKIIIGGNNPEETKKRLMYCLYLEIQRNITRIINYKNKEYMENFFQDITDFTIHPNQVILQGEDSVEKWIEDKKYVTYLYNQIMDNIDKPYFFKNELINKKIAVLDRNDNLPDAIYKNLIWRRDSYNPIDTDNSTESMLNIPYTIYSYTNTEDIIEYKRNGGDDNVKIIGYLDENNDPVYMSTLVL